MERKEIKERENLKAFRNGSEERKEAKITEVIRKKSTYIRDLGTRLANLDLDLRDECVSTLEVVDHVTGEGRFRT